MPQRRGSRTLSRWRHSRLLQRLHIGRCVRSGCFAFRGKARLPALVFLRLPRCRRRPVPAGWLCVLLLRIIADESGR